MGLQWDLLGYIFLELMVPQPILTCSTSTIETLEKGAKYV